MNPFFKKIALGAALAAGVVMTASPAQARDRYYRHGNDGAAIALGVLSVAAFAALAASERNHYYYRGGYYYPRSYYYPRHRVYRAYPRYYAYPYRTYAPRYRTRYYYRGW